MTAPLQTEQKTERQRLQFARLFSCVIWFDVMTKRPTYPGMPMGQVDRHIGKLAGVSAALVKKVRNADAHLSPEALARLEEGLGHYAVFQHRVALMGEAFEEGLATFEYHRSLPDLRRRPHRRRVI